MKFIKRATRILEKAESFEAINKLAQDKMGSKISIGFPKLSKEKNNSIYFIVDTPNLSTVTLACEILRLLDFDYEDADEKGDVVILNKQVDSPQTISTLADDINPFTLENYNNILALLKKNYPECYRDTDVDSHQDKRRRSVSPPSRGSSFFPENSSPQQDEVKLPTPEIVAEYLQKAPWWPALSTSPEKAAVVIDQACGRAKRALNPEQSSDIRPTGAAK